MITFDMGRIVGGKMYNQPYRRFAFWQGREENILELAYEFFERVSSEGWMVVCDSKGNYALSDGSVVGSYQTVTAEAMAHHMALLWLQRLEDKLSTLLEESQTPLPQ